MSRLDIDLTSGAGSVPRHVDGPPTEAARDPFDDAAPPVVTLELVEAGCVGSSWDLLSGLDVVETKPGELFDDFFDSESGAARDLAAPDGLSKDQWLLAFAVELAELDRQLEPRDVIRLANVLWGKKRHLPPETVARDVYSTGWMRRARDRESSRSA